jgi:integrase
MIPAELMQAARLARQSAKGGEVGINRLLTRLQHLFSWALGEGYCTETPFKRNGVTVIRLNPTAERARSRRLEGDEEARLVAAAGPHLQALILAALETGCRKGELLSLQWGQVDLDGGTVFLPGEKTKTAEDRTVPITARLRAVLEMRWSVQHALLNPDGSADGEDVTVPATFYVFGNEAGEQVKSIKTAWKLACRRGGITGLCFHDLRRECGSRLLETPGVSLMDARDWLGHASVTMTNTYLSTTIAKLQSAAARVDKARREADAKARKAAKALSGKRCTRLAQRPATSLPARPLTASGLAGNSLN